MRPVNNNNEHPGQDNGNRSAKLLEGLLHDDTPAEIKDKIRVWFKSEASQAEKYEALKEWFEELRENTTPDQYDRACLIKIQELLDFPEAVRIRPASKRQAAIPLRRMALRIAAVVVPALITAGGIYFLSKTGRDPVDEMTNLSTVLTITAENQKHIFLPDSSQVWLNGQSTIAYGEDFISDRTIELTGEAYFTVMRAGGAPFTVKTGDISATVLGTQFNVKAWPGSPETEITLDEGSLQVNTPGERVVMKPDQRVTVDNRTNMIRSDATRPDREQWREGIEFRDTPIREVFDRVAAHFNMNIQIQGDLPDDTIRFGFDYDATPETVFSILSNTLKYFTYEIQYPDIVIMAN